MTANLLAAHQHWLIFGEPHIAHDPAVMPPVVPGVFTQALCEARDGRRARPVVDLHRKLIAFPQVRSDVEVIRCVAAFVAAEFGPIQPDARFIKCRAEVDFIMKPGLLCRRGEVAEVPRHAHVIFVRANIPGVRDGN